MRCIEITESRVLVMLTRLININMRCIEILFGAYGVLAGQEININMRCIEMNRGVKLWELKNRLTLT